MAFPAQLVYLKETWKPVRVAIVNGSHADEGAVNDAQAFPRASEDASRMTK